MKTLVILAHPDYEKSIANKQIIKKLKEKEENIEIRNIFKLYQDYKINIETEQQALINADTVIFQFPFFWYGMPAILKLWFDEVFNFNFAYGPEGNKLNGKNFLISTTVGGPEDAYSPLGYNHFRIEELLRPMEQTAYLAQMNFLKPVYEHRMVYVPGVYNTEEAVIERANNQTNRLLNVIDSLKNAAPEITIKNFVKDWFAHFDVFAEDGYFNSYIANSAEFKFPEGTYVGHEGFSEWYADIKKKIKPNNTHTVESIQVSESNDKYKVDLSVKLAAETVEGEAFQIGVRENWEVEVTQENRVKIHKYVVEEI